MMRRRTGTLLLASLAAFIGIGLFLVKHEVKDQEARLATLNQEIRRNQEFVHVLKAEWSYLNDPARLRRLAETHLGMKSSQPRQIALLEDLPRDLPAGTGAPALMASESPPSRPAPSVKPGPLPSQPTRRPRPVTFAGAQPQAAVPAPALLPESPAKTEIAAATAPVSAGRVMIIRSPALAGAELASSGEAR